jgi:hypothetical protein
MPKGRPYPDDIQAKVIQGNRNRVEIVLSGAEMKRLGHRKRNPLKVIREFCTDCMGGSIQGIRLCTSVGCAFWPYRLGKNPYRTPGKTPARPFTTVPKRETNP